MAETVQNEQPTEEQAQEQKQEVLTLKDKFAEMYKAAGKQQPEAKLILGFLWKKCKEDSGLAEDIFQEHKSWQRMYKFIENKARERLEKGNDCVAVWHEDVYEWAEDYFRLDDKEQVEKEEREAEERKKKLEEEKKKRAEKAKKTAEKKKKKSDSDKEKEQKETNGTAETCEPDAVDQEEKPAEKKEEPQQMSLFDMMNTQ